MLNVMNKKKKRKGFTLVELVVVIAILGILATIAIPKFSESRKSAAIAAHNANVRIIKSVVTMYLADNPIATGTLDNDDIKGRFDGDKMPTPNFAADGKDAVAATVFTITIGSDKNITVSPSEMKIEDGDVKPVTTTP